MTDPYRYQRGETIVVLLEAFGATDAEVAIVTGVTAVLKAAINGAVVPDTSKPVAATFSVSARAAADGIGPGWNLILAAGVSADLAPGLYVTNANLTLAGGAVDKTDPLFIRIEQTTS